MFDLFGLARSLVIRGNFKRAEEVLHSVLKDMPQDKKVQQLLGLVEHSIYNNELSSKKCCKTSFKRTDALFERSQFLPPVFQRTTNVLNGVQLDNLLHIADKYSDSFEVSEVFGKTAIDLLHRNSMRLKHTDAVKYVTDLFTRIVEEKFKSYCEALSIDKFSIQDIEIKFCRYGTGSFFKAHKDDIRERHESNVSIVRKISFAYYFYHCPKAFTGGELVLYPTCNVNNIYTKLGGKIFSPDSNSLIVFPSNRFHEVLPVLNNFQHSKNFRYAINGHIWGVAKS